MNRDDIRSMVSLAKEATEFWAHNSGDDNAVEWAVDLNQLLKQLDKEQRLYIFEQDYEDSFGFDTLYVTKDDVKQCINIDDITDDEMKLLAQEMPESISIWWRQIIGSAYVTAQRKAVNK